MKIETSIYLIETIDNVSKGVSKFKCVKHEIALNLVINHTELNKIYNLDNPSLEAMTLALVFARKFNLDETNNPSRMPLILFPVAEFELFGSTYHVLLCGQEYSDYVVVHEFQNAIVIDHELSEAISDELANRSVKFEHQNFSISFFSFMKNYTGNYINSCNFEEYMNLPAVAEECLYLDIAAY